MSRSYDFVVVGVITIIAVVIHLMGVTLFAPDQPLYAFATDGTEVMNGTQRANLWYQIIAIWTPLLAVGGIIAWSAIREYKRQVSTVSQRVPR
jgi:hypothetical protein